MRDLRFVTSTGSLWRPHPESRPLGWRRKQDASGVPWRAKREWLRSDQPSKERPLVARCQREVFRAKRRRRS